MLCSSQTALLRNSYSSFSFSQKKKWSELDKLNKNQELKFVNYVNGMYFLFFRFILSVLYENLKY
jgi:hypothetical protein